MIHKYNIKLETIVVNLDNLLEIINFIKPTSVFIKLDKDTNIFTDFEFTFDRKREHCLFVNSGDYIIKDKGVFSSCGKKQLDQLIKDGKK